MQDYFFNHWDCFTFTFLHLAKNISSILIIDFKDNIFRFILSHQTKISLFSWYRSLCCIIFISRLFITAMLKSKGCESGYKIYMLQHLKTMLFHGKFIFFVCTELALLISDAFSKLVLIQMQWISESQKYCYWMRFQFFLFFLNIMINQHGCVFCKIDTMLVPTILKYTNLPNCFTY